MYAQRPDSGATAVASSQVLFQRNWVITDNTFAQTTSPPVILPDGPATVGVYVRGTPSIRVQVLHYGTYNDGLATWAPRPWLAWRVVGYNPGSSPTNLTNVVRSPFVPISTPQTTSINNPVSLSVDSGGLYYVSLEFDVSGGTSAPNQGYDRVFVSISAGG